MREYEFEQRPDVPEREALRTRHKGSDLKNLRKEIGICRSLQCIDLVGVSFRQGRFPTMSALKKTEPRIGGRRIRSRVRMHPTTNRATAATCGIAPMHTPKPCDVGSCRARPIHHYALLIGRRSSYTPSPKSTPSASP